MPTTRFSWTLPTVGGSINAWGTMLNSILSDIDSKMVGLAGATLTGLLGIKTDSYTVTAKGSISGSQTLDLATARFFTATISGATTFTAFSNCPATGRAVFFTLQVTNAGSLISWPASVKWPGATAPTLTTSGVDVLAFYTVDGGTTWRGALAQLNSH